MINYESLKKIFLDNKSKFVLAGCFVIVFLLGLGTGRLAPETKKPVKSQPKYTAKTEEKPVETEVEEAKTTEAVKETAQATKGDCVVKGNASSKIYHVKGGAFYDRLKSPQCFTSETEAKAAGFRKSSR